LLDDSGGAVEQCLPAVRERAEAELGVAATESVTIRLLPPGRAALCTIVATGTDTYRRLELTACPGTSAVAVRENSI
jgi:hypothetical protein